MEIPSMTRILKMRLEGYNSVLEKGHVFAYILNNLT